MRFLYRGAELLQIFRIGGGEDAAPRLNLVHVELLGYVGRKIFEFDLLRGRNWAASLAVRPFPPDDEFAKRIGSYGDAVPGSGRKLYRGARSSRRLPNSGQKPCPCCQAGALAHKFSAIRRVHARQCTREV